MIAEYYEKDYLGQDVQVLYKFSKKLVEMLDHGNFEWDTLDTDYVLMKIKTSINRIDI